MGAINVVMIGASRSGKTSILASMLNNVKNQQIAQHFIFTENNSLEYNRLGREDRADVMLRDIICGMQDMVNPNLVGQSVPKMGALFGTQGMFTYKFRVESDNNQLDIHFTDVSGEHCVNTHIAYDEYISKIKSSQILVVAVDVPSMMYAKLNHKAKLNMGMNLPDEVQEAVQKLGQNFNDSRLFRMVIFVPIKCEYWIHHNLMDEVCSEIKKVYENSIPLIKGYSNIRSFILPVETIGGCEFDHHSEDNKSFILLSNRSAINGLEHEDEMNEKYAFRSEKLGSNSFRLKNGEIYELGIGDESILTSERPYHPYFLEEVGIQIPYAWFIRKEDIGYKPKNCEQLLLHILKFSIEAQKDLNTRGLTWWDSVRNFFSFGGYFDEAKLRVFSKKMGVLKEKGVLRDIPFVGKLVDNL